MEPVSQNIPDGTDTPKVSVCVVTYNHGKYLEECLESIVTQKTDFRFEVIVGEDCSTDNTREILKKMEARYPDIIRPVYYEKNVGSSYNYNHVHAITRGMYIMHIDGDDLFLPGKIQKQADFLDGHSDYSVVWHKAVFFNDEGLEAPEYTRKNIPFPGETITLDYVLRTGTVATHSSVMYRKSAKKTYYPEFLTLDLFFTLEFLMSGKGMILNDVLGKYRVLSSSSVSKSSKGILVMREACISHWDHYRKLLPQYRSEIFVFSAINFLIDLKNKRSSAMGFLKLMLATIGPFSPAKIRELWRNLEIMRVPKVFYDRPAADKKK